MEGFADQQFERSSWWKSHKPRGRRVMFLLLTVLTVALVIGTGSVALYLRAFGSSAVRSRAALASLPADRFMQSVVTDDGALGWNQLCPELKAALPKEQLTLQAAAAKAEAKRQGLSLTERFLSATSRQGGGERRRYLVTAHWASGATQQKTFAIMTQKSGCVEDVGYENMS